MSKLQKAGLGVLVLCLIISGIGNYSLMKKKEKSDKVIRDLKASIKTKSREIKKGESEVDALIDKIKEQSDSIIKLKKFKPKIRYIKVKEKDTVKSDLYNSVVNDLDLCVVMNDTLIENVSKIKGTADIMEMKFKFLKIKLDKREAEHEKLMRFTLHERDELYKRLSRKWSLVIGPSISISTDFTFRFSLSITYGKRIF